MHMRCVDISFQQDLLVPFLQHLVNSHYVNEHIPITMRV